MFVSFVVIVHFDCMLLMFWVFLSLFCFLFSCFVFVVFLLFFGGFFLNCCCLLLWGFLLVVLADYILFWGYLGPFIVLFPYLFMFVCFCECVF